MWWYPDRRLIRAVVRAGGTGNRPVGSPIRMLIVVQPPGSSITGAVLTPSVAVAFMDVYGNLVANVGATVTATPSVGTMSGTTAVQAGTTAAVFSNLIFDDIVNTVVSSRTITFSCPGFASVVSTAVVVTKASLKLWLEADYGIVDAAGVALTSWADRSPSAANMTPGSGMTGPTYRDTGFGGSTLPYWEFNNVHGAATQRLAALAMGTFSVFMVGLREVADSNGDWYEYFVSAPGTTIMQGLRPNGPAIYASRKPVITLLESSRNDPGAWLTTNVRKLFRHEMDGTNTGHQLYDSGVQKVFGTNGLTTNPGSVATPDGEFHIGFRDSGTPSLNLRGKIAALMAFTPILTSAEATSVETYLAKWLAAGPAIPTAFRGPITLASQVINGVTITVDFWATSGTPDFQSTDTINGTLVFHFSEAIKRFRGTLVFGQPAGLGYRTLLGVRNYVGPFTWDYVTGAGYAPTTNNQQVQINDTVTGFDTVITTLPISGGGFIPTSVFKDCYFSKMTDP